ncbi:MAG TPA: GatB/YqeY domain-containing protein [Deltaproteobacteria bacterium]|nr:GatB/YqeY domain-containing protein [Deltaproteobacteria bacterium]HOI07215.1 GatB/YqeY domain-containing protein [Deltaproteobacteria bacterium]
MLVDTIKSDLGQAMKAGDKQKVSCLRMLISAFKYKQVESHKELDDQEALSVIRSQIKQVTDSYEQYTQGKREDLAAQEKANLAILKSYLPQELSDEEIAAIAKRIIAETNATKKEFGLVMKKTVAEVAGRADGKRVSGIVNGLLH